jgi:hypothetical protein
MSLSGWQSLLLGVTHPLALDLVVKQTHGHKRTLDRTPDALNAYDNGSKVVLFALQIVLLDLFDVL